MYNYFEFVRDETVIVYKGRIYTVLLHLLITIHCKRNYFFDGKMDDFFNFLHKLMFKNWDCSSNTRFSA